MTNGGDRRSHGFQSDNYQTEKAYGGDRRSERFQSNNYNTERIEDRGTSETYLTARIKRDDPAWQELGCLSWDDFCVKYLHRQPLRVDAALDLKAHGRPHKTEKPDNSNVFEYGNSADYLTARIKRDDPAVYARLQAGEFRSVRAAA